MFSLAKNAHNRVRYKYKLLLYLNTIMCRHLWQVEAKVHILYHGVEQLTSCSKCCKITDNTNSSNLAAKLMCIGQQGEKTLSLLGTNPSHQACHITDCAILTPMDNSCKIRHMVHIKCIGFTSVHVSILFYERNLMNNEECPQNEFRNPKNESIHYLN